MIFIWTHPHLKTQHSAESSRKVRSLFLATDFYLTNIEPKPWILPTPLSNKDTPELSGAAAADKYTPVMEPDAVQLREIRLHSWMLYTPQAPVFNLREETITSTLDLRDTFHDFIYAQKRMRHTQNSALMAEGNPKSPKSPTKELSDNDTSEEEQVNPMLRTSKEERHYVTICGSVLATQIALSHSRAQTKQTVERGPSRKIRIQKLPKEKAEDKSTQTSKETKQTK